MLRNLVFGGLVIMTANVFAADGGSSYVSQKSISAGTRVDEVGVGVQVGSLSGVNMEYWLSRDTTLNAALTFTPGNTAVSLAHTWMFHDTFRGDGRAFVPYIGAGGLGVWGNNTSNNRNYNDDYFIFAAQMPVGLEFLPQAQRFSVFGELVPSLEVAPYVVGFLNADIGARFYF